MAVTTKFAPALETPVSMDRAVADLKAGVETATKAQRDAAATAMKAATEVAAFGKSSLAAFVEASQIASTGWQALAQDAAKSTQAAFEQFTRGTQALFAAKTVRERLDVQTSFLRDATETAVSEATRFAKASIDLNVRVAAPLVAQAVVAADKLKV